MTALQAFEAVSRIEAELAAFWAAPDEQTGVPQTKVRSSTMSYAIIAAQAELDEARKTTETLADTHPGRAFVLTTDGRLAPWDVSYDVRAACRLDGGSEPICHDWVELSFGAMAAERAGSVIAALALPEVPLVVELGRGAARTLAATLAARAERLVVDSAHTSPTRIAELIKNRDVGVGDRQFVRTYSFRELVARFFDDALEALSQIRKVTIARTAGPTEPAALLLGWLGSRLGWSFETRELGRDRSGEPVLVTLRDDPRPHLDAGRITGLWIDTSLGGAPLSLACVSDERGRAAWTRSGARQSMHEHALGRRDEAWVLVKAIDATEGDLVYREAIELAAVWSSR